MRGEMSYEQVHGPPATQPAQQKATPTWVVGRPLMAISQLAQVKAVERMDGVVKVSVAMVRTTLGGEPEPAEEAA